MADNNKNVVFEDISSNSPETPIVKVVKQTKKAAKKAAKVAKKAADGYGNSAFKNIDKVIKMIAFVVATTVALLFLATAFVVFKLDKSFKFICALILVVGVVVSLIFLFLIYGIGHIISQNKEILKKLDK